MEQRGDDTIAMAARCCSASMWSVPSDDGEKADGESGESSEDGEVPDEMRWWRHRKWFYSYLLHRTEEHAAPVFFWLPGTRYRAHLEGIEVRFVTANGPSNPGDRQHYVAVHKALVPTKGNNLPNLETGYGGPGVGPPLKSEVEYRLYHDGPVTAMAVWQCNPLVFATASPQRKQIFVFNTEKQAYAKTRPGPADPKALRIPERAPEAHLRAKRAAALRAQKAHLAWYNHTGDCIPDAHLQGLPATPAALAISPCRSCWVAAACGGSSPTLGIWRLGEASKDMRHLQPAASLPLSGEPTCLAFSLGMPHLLCGGQADGSLWLLDVRKQSQAARRPADGSAACGEQPAERDPQSHLVRRAVGGGAVRCIEFSPVTGTLLAVGTEEGTLHIVDIRLWGGPALWTLKVHPKAVTSLSWSAHSPSVVATGCADGRCALWDIRGRRGSAKAVDDPPGQLIFQHLAHADPVAQIAWHPSPKLRGLLAAMTSGLTRNNSIWRPRNYFWPGDTNARGKANERAPGAQGRAARAPKAGPAPAPPPQ